MEVNLIKLVESNYFSLDNNEIFSIINKKCSTDLTNSLNNFLEEIDDVLESNILKECESKFSEIDKESVEIIKEVDKKISSIKNIQSSAKAVTDSSQSIVEEIIQRYDEITNLELKYNIMEKYESELETISAIQSSVILDDLQLASEYLWNLIKTIQPLNENENIGTWAYDRHRLIWKKFQFYYQLVKTQLVKQFQECLKEICWPFISNDLQQTVSGSQIETLQVFSSKFSVQFKQLFVIEIPQHLLDYCDKSVVNNNEDCLMVTSQKFMIDHNIEGISFPVRLLLQPLVKYFQFYFWTDTKINKISKPEWYMTQVIQWISVHHLALQEICDDSVLDLVDVQLEFMRGLMIMTMEKVEKDFQMIAMNSKKNDDLFFHLVEECLTLTMEMRKNFDYPRNYCDPVDVICHHDDLFEKWMRLEQRFSATQLDDVFRSSESWQALSSQCKRVECLNSFVALISTLKERIETVFDISKQLMFCRSVLLELLDDFRRRLVQISKEYNANTQRWYDIMNVIYSVKVILRNWRLDQTFIGIQEHNKLIHNYQSATDVSNEPIVGINNIAAISLYSSKTRTIEDLKLSSDSIFSNVLSLYQHVLEEMEENCIRSAFEDVLERADLYIKTSWLEMGSIVDLKLMSLSPSASGMMLVLRDRLHGLESSLELELFEHVWQGLAAKISKLVFEKVICGHKFNELGASQLDFDIRKNLLPLFLPYTKTPERFFVKCIEACTLLNLKTGTAILIKQILVETLHSDDRNFNSTGSRLSCPIRTLCEIGVFSLTAEEAEFILDLRIDSYFNK